MDASDNALDVRELFDDRANAMYWGSDLSVNQIAEKLDLSKGALYEMIRPLAAELACPRCGTEAVHPNRTALERRLIACPSCGWDGMEADARPIDESPAAAAVAKRPARPVERMRGVRPGLSVPVLIGAAIGVAVLLWAGRRR
jgi:predicted RNA-binding Zn-ribbon protein involved in translation (DUF1610 family)